MTRIAVFSDLHADVHALQDALIQIRQLGCDLVLCAGDIVSRGLFPEETIETLREKRISCVRGNHERWAIRDRRDMSGSDLSRQALAFLGALPESWARVVDGARVVMWHARPHEDMLGIFPDASVPELEAILDEAAADVLIVGHTHLPLRLAVGDRRIVNPGTLLRDPAQPMDTEVEGGTFGVLDLSSMSFSVHRAGDGSEVAPIELQAPPSTVRTRR